MKSKKVLLLGSYGQTNLGDDLLMYNYLAYLHGRGFEQVFVNASARGNVPAVVKQQFPKVSVLPTYETSLLTWVKTIRQVGHIVYGGGTVFKELYSSTGRGRYSVILRIMFFNLLARLLGAKVYYLHIGIGVLETALGRVITRQALSSAALTIFRDDQSFLFAHDTLKLPVSKLCLATDGLFLNDIWQKPWRPSGLRLPKNKPIVGVNLLSDIPDWVDRQEYLRAIKGFVNDLLERGNFVLLIPFQHKFNPNNDYAFMKREIAASLKGNRSFRLLKSVPIEQTASVFKQLDAFVGMRFHSLLIATVTGTPYVALAYDTKCWRFIEENEYPHAIRIEDVSASHLKSVFNSLMEERRKVVPVLNRIASEQFKRGRQCVDHLSF